MVLQDESVFSAALLFLYIACPITVLSLQFHVIPYGKHARPGSGPTLPPALAWFIMESPAVWLTLLLYPLGRHRSHPLALLVISLYLLHYLHRTLIYPLHLLIPNKPPPPAKTKSPSSAGYPLVLMFTGFFFNFLNAYLQSRSASQYTAYPSEGGWRLWGRVAAGLGIFLWGMAVNIRSDLALVRLKAEGGGYKIPRGGWFELVACPNFMGEAAEWLGLAVIAWSPATLAFFLSTCSNLGPRSRAHLTWYREKFGDEYPASNKAILPFIY